MSVPIPTVLLCGAVSQPLLRPRRCLHSRWEHYTAKELVGFTDDSEAVRTATGATVWQRGFTTLDAKEVTASNDDVGAVRLAIGVTDWQTARRRSSV